jgi:carbonic anhydrase/acetyltransferase-like protein (isoleucine patch superfamily)
MANYAIFLRKNALLSPEQCYYSRDPPANSKQHPVMQKYRLVTSDRKIVHEPQRSFSIYRIQATRDFAKVKTGDLGGYIESEANLSHDGMAWVERNAEVQGCASVRDDAVVTDQALVWDDALISGQARVGGTVWVFGNVQISGKALVTGQCVISEDAVITDDAVIADDARVYGTAHVGGRTRLYDQAAVGGDATIVEDAELTGTTRLDANTGHLHRAASKVSASDSTPSLQPAQPFRIPHP